MSGNGSSKLRRRLTLSAAIVAFLIFLYITALPNTFPANDADESGLAGTYTINGVDHLGTEYSGTVTVIEVTEDLSTLNKADGLSTPNKADGLYDLEWVVTGAIQRGQGQLVGDTLTAEWRSVASAADASGRTVYTIEPNGSLVGERFVDGVDQPGTETLFPDP